MRSRTPSSRARSVLILVFAGTMAACTTVRTTGPGAAVVAQLSLERFLQASNARDLQAMGRLFGTSAGPAWDTGSTFGCFFKKIGSWFGGSSCVKKRDVEIRMDAIAQVLRHEDYRILQEEPVAGRLNEALRILVDLTVGGQVVPAVPFVLVRTGGGQWLVEEVDLQRAMARPPRVGTRAGAGGS